MNLPSPDHSPTPSAATRLWRRAWIGPAIVGAAALAMLVWTWQTWADVLVDFGVQLYVPWRLALGQVLYRDIAHYTGPLSIYYNALAFELFGTSLRALEWANLPILLATLAAVYYLARQLGGRFCAVVCGVSFVALFAFAHLTPAGNYNFVCPYEYEYTHATLLCLGCVIFLWRFLRNHRAINAAAAGFLAGLVFLTRAEFFLALAGAVAAGLTFFTLANRKSLPLLARASGVFAGAMLVPVAASIGLLSLAMPPALATRGTLGMWPALLAGHVTVQHFYQHSMGLDDPQKSLRLLGTWSLAYFLAIAIPAMWAVAARRRTLAPHLATAFILGAVAVGWHWYERDWLSLFRPLPVVALVVLGFSAFQLYRLRGDALRQPNAALAAMLATFALILMGKIFLYARIIHYGCWLAMPATMLLLIAVFGWIPAWLKKRGAAAPIYLAGASAVWLIILLIHLSFTDLAMQRLTVYVGNGSDQFRADRNRAVPINNALLAIQQMIPPDKTLVCFPEGIMLNYLSRRQVSTPYVNFNPPDLLLFGEDKMLSALQKSPPDYVLIVHKTTDEFGVRFFGRDYGQKLYAWVLDNYRRQPLPMIDLGAEPLRDNRFGIRLYIPRERAYGEVGPPSIAWNIADSISCRE